MLLSYYAGIERDQSASAGVTEREVSASDAPYLGWKGGLPKNVFGRLERLQTETSPGGRFPCTPYLTPEPNLCVHKVLLRQRWDPLSRYATLEYRMQRAKEFES